MNILILGKEKFEGMFSNSENISLETFKSSSDDTFDYDKWLSQKTDEFLNKKPFDLIILPFSISEHNFAEFSGLRIAAFIRLSNNKENSRKPILFMGPENTTVVTKMSDLGSILFTPFVFFTQKRLTSDTIEDWANRYLGDYIGKCMTDDQYSTFLNRFHVNPPARFDNRHSIANEWAIWRWIQLYKLNPDEIQVDLTSSLYFKYLIAKNGRIKLFDKKFYKKHPSLEHYISGIKNKHIVYIDDEANKGWGVLMSSLMEKSGATLSVFPVETILSSTKDLLLEKIKEFLTDDFGKHKAADCYIVDLRLHPDDSSPDIDFPQLSGHIISRYIKENINMGSQIVIFTASNKSWNVIEAISKTHVNDYVVKESPEMGYTPEESYLALGQFMASVKKAVERSYIKDIYQELDSYENSNGEIDLLYEFIELLNMDNGNANPSIIKSCALNLIVFIEQHLKERFCIDGACNVTTNDSFPKRIGNFKNKLFFRCEQNGGYKNVKEAVYYNNVTLKPSDVVEAGANADITNIVAPLYLYYSLGNDAVNLVVKLKNERNTNIAHGGSETRLTITDLKNIFWDVISLMLKKSFNK